MFSGAEVVIEESDDEEEEDESLPDEEDQQIILPGPSDEADRANEERSNGDSEEQESEGMKEGEGSTWSKWSHGAAQVQSPRISE